MIIDTTAPPLPQAIDAALRRMRLPYPRQGAPDVSPPPARNAGTPPKWSACS